MRKNLIKLPDNINPGGLITLKAASQLTGIPITTFYELRKEPGCGLTFYHRGKRTRLMLKVDELVRWINMVYVEVDVRKFTFTSESVSRGKAAPASRHLLSYSDPASCLHQRAGAGNI